MCRTRDWLMFLENDDHAVPLYFESVGRAGVPFAYGQETGASLDSSDGPLYAGLLMYENRVFVCCTAPVSS